MNGILIVRLRQPNRHKLHRAAMLAMERFPEPYWPGLLVVVRDLTISVSRGGGPMERLGEIGLASEGWGLRRLNAPYFFFLI